MSQDVRHPTPAPLLIRIAGVFAGFWAVLVGVILLGLLAMIVLDAGSFEFNGRPVSRDEFARQFPSISAALGIPAIYLGAVAIGVWRERAWVRPAVLVFWILISLGLVVQAFLGILDAVVAVAWPVINISFVVWYFYFKENVVSYYRALRGASPTVAADHPDPSAAV